MPSCGVCLSVCLSVRVSVTFMGCVKMNKDVFKFFSPLGSHTILVFPHQTGWQYFDGNPPNGGVECRWGRLKSRNQWLSGLAIDNCCTVVCISHSTLRPGIGRPRSIDTLLCTVRRRPSAVSRYTQSWWMCVWQHGWTLGRKQQNRIELYDMNILSCSQILTGSHHSLPHVPELKLESWWPRAATMPPPLHLSDIRCKCLPMASKKRNYGTIKLCINGQVKVYVSAIERYCITVPVTLKNCWKILII